MNKKCCHCKNVLSPSRIFMLSKHNDMNPYNIDFYVCASCYKKWEKLWTEKGSFKKLNWAELFFKVFLKDKYTLKEKVLFT